MLKATLFVKTVLLGILLFCLSIVSMATHIVGGEISYVQTSATGYEITLKVYRDCGFTNVNGTDFDALAAVAIYNSQGGMVELLLIPLVEQNVNFVPVVLENPCFVLPPDVCVEEAIYTDFVTPSAIS